MLSGAELQHARRYVLSLVVVACMLVRLFSCCASSMVIPSHAFSSRPFLSPSSLFHRISHNLDLWRNTPFRSPQRPTLVFLPLHRSSVFPTHLCPPHPSCFSPHPSSHTDNDMLRSSLRRPLVPSFTQYYVLSELLPGIPNFFIPTSNTRS
jgi:hypothetical protein